MKAPKSIVKWNAGARAAMTAEPGYFVWWYTIKSVALVGAIGLAAYFAGKSAGMQQGRR